MGFKCGIAGLPNVGKSTLFNALTAASVPAENYPFCTVDPNVGTVQVPDDRLPRVAQEFSPKKMTPTSMQFVDIAGLVKGASHGEGLGNQFLAHIREMDAIAHVVRCFEGTDVTHVMGRIDPVGDIETVNAELYLKDLETVDKQISAASRLANSGDKKALHDADVLKRVKAQLESGQPARTLEITETDLEIVRALFLISSKKVLYVANIGEDEVLEGEPGQHTTEMFKYAESTGSQAISLCGRLESDIASLPPDDQDSFMAEFGLKDHGLHKLIHAGYRLLRLITFFSGNENEVRAWTVPEGTLAPNAAGVIHTDFQKGFISAEVFSYSDLVEHGSIRALREHGLYHIQGRDYVVQDGDVVKFRFNV